MQRAWVWPSAAPWRWNHWPDEHPPQPPWFRSLRWGERDDRWVSGPSCETVRTAEPRGAEGQAGFQWVYDQPKNDPGHPLLVVTHSMDVVAARNTIGARRWVFVTRRGNTMGRGAGCSSRGAETRWGAALGVRHAARKHDGARRRVFVTRRGNTMGHGAGCSSRGAETRLGHGAGCLVSRRGNTMGRGAGCLVSRRERSNTVVEWCHSGGLVRWSSAALGTWVPRTSNTGCWWTRRGKLRPPPS